MQINSLAHCDAQYLINPSVFENYISLKMHYSKLKQYFPGTNVLIANSCSFSQTLRKLIGPWEMWMGVLPEIEAVAVGALGAGFSTEEGFCDVWLSLTTCHPGVNIHLVTVIAAICRHKMETVVVETWDRIGNVI